MREPVKKPKRSPVPRPDRTSPADDDPIRWPPELRAEVVRIIAAMLVASTRRDRDDA